MAVPYLGFGAYVGVGVESVYGTAVARARWTRPTTIGLSKNVKNQPVSDLSAEIDTLVPIANYQEAEETGGTIAAYAPYNDYVLTTLLYAALGSNVNAGAGPYTHTMVPAKALPSLTIEQGANDRAEIFEGCKVNSLEIDWEIGKLAVITAELICETSGGETTTSSPTFVTPTYSHYSQAGTLGWNSLTSTIKRVKLRINNNLIRRPQLGSNVTAEPVRGGIMEVSLEIEQEKTAANWRTGFIARTQSDATITFTASASAALAITLHNAQIDTYNDDVADVGPVMERFTLKGYRDASDKGLQIVVTNSNASYI